MENVLISHSHGGWEVQDQAITKSKGEDFPKGLPPKPSSAWDLRFQHVSLDYKGKEGQIFILAGWEAYA